VKAPNTDERRKAMDDREIMRLFDTRSEKAIEAISDKYGAYCLSIAKNILQNYEDAEECVNDAYLKLWENAHEKKPANLKLFLAKIVRNLALNKYEEKNCQKRGGGEVTLALEEISELVSGETQTEAELSYSELVKSVNGFLRTASERDCGVFINRYFDFHSTAEIAEAYGLRESNVLKILSRMREKLKKYLEKEGYHI
jgi:RNA polymerase sigma-70 factor (ECF subfamily)